MKNARKFDIASIGKFACIPFFTGGAGILIGGACTAALLSRGMPVTRARKISVTLFAVLMTSSIPAFSLTTGWVVDHYSYRPVFVGFGILPVISAAIV